MPHAAFAAALFAALPSFAAAADRCAAYGDEDTDFTWRLCPGGEKYERQYLYFGFWGKFYRVNPGTGACDWQAEQSAWACPGKTIRCNEKRCG
jgi:hypothetical protein